MATKLTFFEQDWEKQPPACFVPNKKFYTHFLWNGAQNFDLIKRTALIESATYRQTYQSNSGIVVSGDPGRLNFPSVVSPGIDFTIVVSFVNLANTSSGMLVSGKTYWANAEGFFFTSNTDYDTIQINGGDGGTFPSVSVPGVGRADGRVRTLAVRFRGAFADVAMDGKFCGSATLGSSAGAWPSGLGIGCFSGMNIGNTQSRLFLGVAVVPGGNVLDLSTNMWQLFDPERLPRFLPVGGGPVTHPTSGAVVGNTATVNGTALRYRAHATTGAVTGLTSTVTGTAKRYRLHTTTGAVTGLTSTVTGSATIQPAPGIHVTSGDVVAGVGTVTGTAKHVGVHTTTGVLSGFSAEVVGAAQRSGAVIVHGTSGVLAGYDSVVTGVVTNQGSMTLTPADIQAIVAAIKAEIMPVNIVRVNNIDVDGTGADNDPWGPV